MAHPARETPSRTRARVKNDSCQDSLEKLLGNVEVDVLPHRVMNQRPWRRKRRRMSARVEANGQQKKQQQKKIDLWKHSLQLSGMTLRARGRRSSKEASSTTALISGYDITAQLATEKGGRAGLTMFFWGGDTVGLSFRYFAFQQAHDVQRVKT